MIIACILHTFRISHPVDEKGQKVDLEVDWKMAGFVA